MYSKYDLVLVAMVETAFDIVALKSIWTSVLIDKWEAERKFPGLVVDPIFPPWAFDAFALLLLLALLIIPASRSFEVYAVFSISAPVAAVSILSKLYFLPFDRFVAGPLIACSTAVLAVQLVLIALFVLKLFKPQAGHSDREVK